MTDIDFEARKRIISETSANFFVEAGAGSGKTAALVRRMVAMVESGIEIDKICAITFTKAAAAEFYCRFRKLLIERSVAGVRPEKDTDLPETTHESAAKCMNALRHIDLCFMGTIDSFCNMVLNEHPVRAGIPSSSLVCSDDRMKALYKREFSRIRRGEYGEELLEKCRLYSRFVDEPDKLFVDALHKVMQVRNAETIYNRPQNKSVEELIADKKAEAVRFLEALGAHPELAYKNKHPDYNELLKDIGSSAWILHSNWDDSFTRILGYLRALCKKNKDESAFRIYPNCPSDFEMYRDEYFEEHYTRKTLSWYTLKTDGTPLHEVLRIMNEQQYSVVADFVVSCAKHVADKLKKEGQLCFFDYLLYLRDLLKKDAESGGKLIKHISERHSYFLIDEFQDTNPIQAEIFFYLASDAPTADWRSCVPRPGSLFIVGDPKQSIYRFRSADVAFYLKVKELFRGEVGEVLQLTRNFRSTLPIITRFNELFNDLLPEDTEEQSRFSEIPLEGPVPGEDIFGGMYGYNIGYSENDYDKVAGIISTLVDNPSYHILHDKVPGEIKFSDFMVITHAKTHLADYMRAFTERNIPFRVEGEVKFSDCPALAEVSAILSAVAYPDDPMRIYAALTGKVFGIRDETLYELSKKDLKLSVFRDQESCDAVKAAFDSIRSLRFASENMTASMLFTAISESFCICERYTDNVEYYFYALELLRSAEISGEVTDIQKGADYVRELISGNSEVERCPALSKDDNRVHLANLHKVKGLQANIVILAAGKQKGHAPEERSEQNGGQAKHWFFSFDRVITESFPEAMAKESESQAAEKARLLYVAATRAASALIVGTVTTSKGISAETPWTFPGNHRFEDFFANYPIEEKVFEPVNNDAALNSVLHRKLIFDNSKPLLPGIELRRPSAVKLASVVSSENDFENTEEADVRSKTVRTDAALVGTMAHRLMELLVSLKEVPDTDTLISSIIAEYAAGEKDYKQLLKGIADKVRSGGYPQQSAAPADILSELRDADEVHCELPFTWRDDSSEVSIIWTGVMDLVYLKNGKWHILDYKTNADGSDLEEKYKSQLEAYRKAFEVMTGFCAETLIYHIDV